MRKAIGIYEIIVGAFVCVLALFMILGTAAFVEGFIEGMQQRLAESGQTLQDSDALVSALTIGIKVGYTIELIVAVAMIILGALSLGNKMKDKTVGIWAIILGIFCGGIILLILGIILITNTNKLGQPEQSTAAAGSTEGNAAGNMVNNDAAVDAEIEVIKKKIELAKLKKEAEKLNSEK